MEELRVNKKRNWIKYSIWIITLLLIVGVGSFGFYKHYSAKENDEKVIASLQGEEIDKTIEQVVKDKKVDVSEIDYDYWTEYRAISTMHEMSHQKVKAEAKWGAVEMTEERVNMLYSIVNNSNFKEKLPLLKILSKWKAEDFRTADQDHNTLWEILGGTIGKAEGILSIEEEKAFIEQTFRSEEGKTEN